MNSTVKQKFQLDKIDAAIELIREVQNSGQWSTLEKSKSELYKARQKLVITYEQAEKRLVSKK